LHITRYGWFGEKIIDYIAFVFPDLLFSLKIASDKAQNKP